MESKMSKKVVVMIQSKWCLKWNWLVWRLCPLISCHNSIHGFPTWNQSSAHVCTYNVRKTTVTSPKPGRFPHKKRHYKSLAPQLQWQVFGVWFSQELVFVTMVLSLRDDKKKGHLWSVLAGGANQQKIECSAEWSIIE